MAGYFFKNCLQNCGGGTGILFRDSVNVSLVDGKETSPSNFLSVLLKCTIILHVIEYRPQYSSLHPALFSLMNSLSF